KIGNHLSKLLAFLGILARILPCAPRNSRHLCSDSYAAFIQGFNCDLVAFAGFTENVVFGYATIFKHEFASRRRTNPQLVFLLAHGETGELLLYQERRDPLVSSPGIDGSEQYKESRFFSIRD